MRVLGRVFLVAAVLACGGSGDGGTGPAPVASLSLAPGNDTSLSVGASRPLSVTLKDANGVTLTGRQITWSTSDAGKVSLSATSGASITAHAIAIGSATITATSEGKTDNVTVAVISPIATIALSGTVPDTLVSRGETVALTAVAKDGSNATVGGVIFAYTSSDQNVATVTSGGVVVAVADGSTNITASAGGVTSAPVAIRVRRRFALLTLSPRPASVRITSTASLTATPQDAGGFALTGLAGPTFTSADNNTVTVGASTGVVSGVALGTAVVTASLTTPDGTHSDTLTVTVIANFPNTASVDPVGITAWSPASVDIAAGGSVVFGSNGIGHSVQFTTVGAPANTAIFSAGTVSVVFPTAGTFNYICGVHGVAMSGTVVVH
jgi:plastocyanin